MLSRINTLVGYKLNALDGEIGEVDDFYFDDRHWTIRYLVAETGSWLSTKLVLISPYAVTEVIHNGKLLSIALTKKQIQKSPSMDDHKPVSRQFEEAYHEYYQWPAYWSGPSVWGSSPRLVRKRAEGPVDRDVKGQTERNLRCFREIVGYHIQALDGEVGHVEDCIVDEETWTIRYLIVGTKNWWPGKKVMVSPEWIERISWDESKVFISLTREAIIGSPVFTEGSLPTREYENSLHLHYHRKGYWIEDLKVA